MGKNSLISLTSLSFSVIRCGADGKINAVYLSSGHRESVMTDRKNDEDVARPPAKLNRIVSYLSNLAQILSLAATVIGCGISIIFFVVSTLIGIWGLTHVEEAREIGKIARILPTDTPTPWTPVPTYTLTPTWIPIPPTSTHTPYPTPTPTRSVALPFSDDLDSGPGAEWQPISGVWRTVDGRYTVTDSKFESAHSLVGDPSWRDYVIDVDYSTSDSYAIVAVLVRAGGPNGLGLACLTQPGWSTVAWKIWQDRDWETLATKKGGANEGHIRVEVRGSTFVCDFNGLTQLTITDDSTSTGRVGVGVKCRSDADCPVFDNFVVNPLDH